MEENLENKVEQRDIAKVSKELEKSRFERGFGIGLTTFTIYVAGRYFIEEGSFFVLFEGYVGGIASAAFAAIMGSFTYAAHNEVKSLEAELSKFAKNQDDKNSKPY